MVSRTKKNYGFVLTGALLWTVIAIIALFMIPAIVKWWRLLFAKPTLGSIPTWAIVVVAIVILMAIRNKRRTGGYV